MKVVALRTDNGFWSLTQGKEYIVIGLDHDCFRVIDDKCEPILFPKGGFKLVDDSVPPDWVWQRESDDVYYADPPELARPGFYEQYFDGKPEIINQFNDYLRRAGLLCRSG